MSLIRLLAPVMMGGLRQEVPKPEIVAVSGITSNPSAINANKFVMLDGYPTAGDLIVVHITMGTITSSGYTLARSYTNSDNYVNNLYYKYATGGEGTVINYKGTDAVAAVVRYVDQIEVGNFYNSTTDEIDILPPTTTPENGVLLVSAINRRVTDMNSKNGLIKIGPGISSNFFSVNMFYGYGPIPLANTTLERDQGGLGKVSLTCIPMVLIRN